MITSKKVNSNCSDEDDLNLGLNAGPSLNMWIHAPWENGGHGAGAALGYSFGAPRERRVNACGFRGGLFYLMGPQFPPKPEELTYLFQGCWEDQMRSYVYGTGRPVGTR